MFLWGFMLPWVEMMEYGKGMQQTIYLCDYPVVVWSTWTQGPPLCRLYYTLRETFRSSTPSQCVRHKTAALGCTLQTPPHPSWDSKTKRWRMNESVQNGGENTQWHTLAGLFRGDSLVPFRALVFSGDPLFPSWATLGAMNFSFPLPFSPPFFMGLILTIGAGKMLRTRGCDVGGSWNCETPKGEPKFQPPHHTKGWLTPLVLNRDIWTAWDLRLTVRTYFLKFQPITNNK